MKKLNLLFTALLLMCCVGIAKAEEVTIDGIRYDVITDTKQATVISGGTKYSGDIVIPSEITYNNVTYNVTSIGSSAFYYCKGLTSITIPNSVTSIGNHAFSGCSGLTSITIPNSVTSIGYYAFQDCSGLKEVHINDLVAWCSIDFDKYANPLSYAHNLYLNNELITELVIPTSVAKIKNYAFSGCSSLTSVTIPNSVTSIGYEVFDDCTALTNIVIPSSVTSIGEWAFATCSAIETIVVDSENNVYDSRNNCNAIIETATNKLVLGCKSTVVPNDVTAIGYAAFDGCTGLTQITIPNSVTSIEDYAFIDCSGLTSITIPNSVTSIGNKAFYQCSGLTSITIPNSVTSIGYQVFWKCSGLTSITIPNSVTSIGDYAFYYCENLEDVYCLATNVPATRDEWGNYCNPFESSYPESMTLHVPAEAINSYKTTEPWSTFGNIIVYVTPKCAAPVIEYRNGELIIECQTENAEFATTITNDYTGNYNSNAIALTATYNISVYATATGYDNSDTVNATLCWIECDCSANDNTTDVINVPAKALFVTSNNGTINISCSLEGEVVELYTSDAMYIGSTTIENGYATIESGLSKGDIAIIKIAEKSIKVILN